MNEHFVSYKLITYIPVTKNFQNTFHAIPFVKIFHKSSNSLRLRTRNFEYIVGGSTKT